MNTVSWQLARQRQIRLLLWGLVLLGLLASLWSAVNRWKTESRNHRVEITLDYVEIEKIAEAENKPIAAVIARFKRAGVTSIAVQEETLAQLEEQRLITTTQEPGERTFSIFLTSTPTDAFRARLRTIRDAIHVKTGVPVTLSNTEGSLNPLEIAGPYNLIRAIGIGLNPETVNTVKQAGLGVVGRVSNYNGVRPAGISWTLQQLKNQGIKTVIFSGDEMLGFKGYLTDDPQAAYKKSTATLLHENGLNVGIVEFGKQKGEIPLSRAMEDSLIRVHTITGTEMVQADIPSNIQRFLLGARERNIRLLFVRLFLDEKDPLETNADYVEQIVKGLDRGQLLSGAAHGYAELHTPLYLRGLIGLGVAAAFLLLIDGVTWLFAEDPKKTARGKRLRTGVAIGAGIGAVLLVALPVAGMLGAKLEALVAGCLFPALAILHTDYLRPAHGKNSLAVALGQLALMCGITAIGIAAIVGLLADRIFLVKADAFIGVKATLIVPLLLVTVVYALGLRATRPRTFAQAISDMAVRLRDAANQPVFLWQVLVSLVTLAGFALIVMRSGNDPGVGVSSMELKLRAVLDHLLYARPRFKEMFGHAVMILGLIYAAQGRSKWALPLLIVGTVGQASLLNTFCHLHTPLLVSLWRAGLGILFGTLFGLSAYGILSILFGRPATKQAQPAQEPHVP